MTRLDETIECERCGRELKTEKSIEQGYGPICMQKHKEELEEDTAILKLWVRAYALKDSNWILTNKTDVMNKTDEDYEEVSLFLRHDQIKEWAAQVEKIEKERAEELEEIEFQKNQTKLEDYGVEVAQ